MIDILLIAGVALCALSVLLAIVALLRTEAPRLAAIALVAGLGALFAGTLLDDRPLGLNTIAQSWSRLTAGRAPAPAAETPAAPAAPAAGKPAPAAEAPSAPAPAAPAAPAAAPAPAADAPAAPAGEAPAAAAPVAN